MSTHPVNSSGLRKTFPDRYGQNPQTRILPALLILDVTTILPFIESLGLFLMILGLEIAAASAQFLFGHMITRSSDISIKLFHVGFMVLAIFGTINIFMALQIIPQWHQLFPWGLLIFVIILIFVIELKFTENHRKLEKYSAELEIKSRELEKYSKTLEEKVDARTSDLRRKNKMLEETMRQLKDAQQKIVMQGEMASLGNLVAGVAHEINNPIGAVSSAADVSRRAIVKLKKELETIYDSGSGVDKTSAHKTINIISESVKLTSEASGRIAKIVRSLKNFARLDEAEFQKADIREGIDSTISLLQHQLKDRITVSKNYQDIPEISCYPNELNQAFMNILLNAAQAIEGKGAISIDAEKCDDAVLIRISDTGKGIPAEHLNKIFDPGFTLNGVGVGTGLGLSITYNIVKKHNGTIDVKSEVEKGTEITITLPIHQE